MDNTKKTLLATAAVLGCLMAAAAGFFVRANVDLGTAAPGLAERSLLASNESGAGLSESEYFYEVSELLRREYVEPVTVDQKMTDGAVRGMVARLRDPDSQFMNQEQFKAHLANMNGVYEGIGVEVRFEFDKTELAKVQKGEDPSDALMLLPEVFISAVLPGSEADKAGVKSGDRVDEVDGKFVVTFQDVKALRDLQEQVNAGKAKTDALNALRDQLKKKIEANIPTGKVRERLMVGVAGELKLGLNRNGTRLELTVKKGQISVPALVRLPDGSYRLNLFSGAGEAVKEANLSAGATLDLRNTVMGDPDRVLDVLQVLAPAGQYGVIAKEDGKTAFSLVTKSGPSQAVGLTVRVDRSTQGAAAILAESLKLVPGTVVEGEMAAPAKWIQTLKLPDGSGYTLYSGSWAKGSTLMSGVQK